MLMSSKTFGDLVGLTGEAILAMGRKKNAAAKRETNATDRVKTVMISEDETIVEYWSGNIERY